MNKTNINIEKTIFNRKREHCSQYQLLFTLYSLKLYAVYVQAVC